MKSRLVRRTWGFFPPSLPFFFILARSVGGGKGWTTARGEANFTHKERLYTCQSHHALQDWEKEVGEGGEAALHIKGPKSLIFYRLDLNPPALPPVSKVAIKIQLNLLKASY